MQTAHSLGREEAARRLKEKFTAVRNQYGAQVNNLQQTWDDHTFSFGFTTMGMAIGGTVEVGEDAVKLETEIPFMAMLFKGVIEERIRQELDGLLT